MGKTLKSVGNVTDKVRAYLETSPYEFTSAECCAALGTETMQSVTTSLQYLLSIGEVLVSRKSGGPRNRACNIYTAPKKEKPSTELPEWMQIWGSAGVKFNCFEG